MICGYEAVNGKHCVINNYCIVCKRDAKAQLTNRDGGDDD